MGNIRGIQNNYVRGQISAKETRKMEDGLPVVPVAPTPAAPPGAVYWKERGRS